MPDPNNVLLREHGLVFMLLPKVANTSIKVAILKALGRPTEKIHAVGVFECISSQQAKHYPHRIAFVRDPLDRLASCYRDKIVVQSDGKFLAGLAKCGLSPDMTFLEFIEATTSIADSQCNGAAHHFRSMSYSLCDGDEIIPNMVGRFERLSADWARVQDYVLGKTKLDLPDLTHERRTDPAMTSYCARGRAFALQRYRDDVRIFGYRAPYKFEIDPDRRTRGRSICNVHREAYRIARDKVADPAISRRLTDLMAEAFDMGKRMNAKLGASQYEDPE